MEIVIIGGLLAGINALMLFVLNNIRGDVKDISKEIRSLSEKVIKQEVLIDDLVDDKIIKTKQIKDLENNVICYKFAK